MASGPLLIFDKSALQALSVDEAVWLDNFFKTNITPLFYIETLADLEKEIGGGRTPEQIVGDIATKAPDLQANPNAYHLRLLETELHGLESIPMDGRAVLSRGKPVTSRGKTGVVFTESPEQEAFHRWQLHDFLGIERHIAKVWRAALRVSDYDQRYQFFRQRFLGGRSLKDFQEVKARTDEHIHQADQENIFRFGMKLFSIVPGAQERFVRRWQAAGKPPITQFVPYFSYLYSVELFFYLGLASDLISRQRPTNKVDFAYLYYLPFCKVFTSGDKLHERSAPLFMRSNQMFVRGAELKADLARLDVHYSALPDEVKNSGLYRFASSPPEDTSFLVTRLWDRYVPNWRQWKEDSKRVTPEIQEALRKLVCTIAAESRPAGPGDKFAMDESDYVQMESTAVRKKGKWVRFGPDVK